MAVPFGDLHRRALQYIRNASGDMRGVVKVEWFDTDHEPIGPNLRADLLRVGMIEEIKDGLGNPCIRMTDSGRAELPKA